MDIQDILIDPSTKEPIIINWKERKIYNLDSEKYLGKIDGDIPIILPKEYSDVTKSTELHEKTNSEFNYLDHYMIDSDVFDYFAVNETPNSRDEKHRLNQKIISKIITNSKVILDIGCGNGWLSKAVQNEHNNIISVDVSIINAKKVLEGQPHKNHKALVADVFNLPIADESIDCIIASEIMEHVANPKLFINELLRPLKRGGKLIITTPFEEVIPYYLCVHCNKLTPANGHIHSFDKSKVIDLIPNSVSSYRVTAFGNKYLRKVRFYLLIRKLPFFVYNMFDFIANKLFKSQTRLIVEIIK